MYIYISDYIFDSDSSPPHSQFIIFCNPTQLRLHFTSGKRTLHSCFSNTAFFFLSPYYIRTQTKKKNKSRSSQLPIGMLQLRLMNGRPVWTTARASSQRRNWESRRRHRQCSRSIQKVDVCARGIEWPSGNRFSGGKKKIWRCVVVARRHNSSPSYIPSCHLN